MTDEERRWALRGHYVLESQREVQVAPEPEPEPEPEQPAKASFPKGRQAGG